MSTETDRAELVERLAREAGYPARLMTLSQFQTLGAFAALVAAECARVIENRAAGDGVAVLTTAIRERFGIAASQEKT